MDDALLMGVLHRLAAGSKEIQTLPRGELGFIAKSGEG